MGKWEHIRSGYCCAGSEPVSAQISPAHVDPRMTQLKAFAAYA